MGIGDEISRKVENLLGSFLGFVIIMAVIAATVVLIFTSIGDVNAVFANNASLLNNSVAEAIAPVFPHLFGTVGLLAIAGIVLGAMAFRGARNRF